MAHIGKQKHAALFAVLDTTTEIKAGLEYSTRSKKIKGSATEGEPICTMVKAFNRNLPFVGHIPSTMSDHEDIAGPLLQPHVITPENNLTMIDLTSPADSHDNNEHTPTAADTTMKGIEAEEIIPRTPLPGLLLPLATLSTATDDSLKVLKGFSNPYNKNRYLHRF